MIMTKQDISSREDVHVLVSNFYAKIRQHETLGIIFNTMIKDWDGHIDKLTTFWESNIFFKSKYYGNPLEAHVNVDQRFDNTITQEHFGLWLNLWIETIDELYEGEYADKTKFRARKMATFLFMKIFEARQ